MTDIVTVDRILITLLLVALVVILATRRLTVPYTLGLVVMGVIIGVLPIFPELRLTPDLVLFVFLPALLFEGAWSISVGSLKENWLPIFLLAVPGVLLELVLIAVPLQLLTKLNWGTAFLLGAILTPTDPVAVLSIFRQLKINERLSAIIEGESLFNDGAAGALYQVFLMLVLISVHHEPVSTASAVLSSIGTFLLEAGGGTLIGIAGGYLVSRFVRHIDDPLIETTITIVTAYGIYLLADVLHTSGILAVIFAGLILGSYGQFRHMSENTRQTVSNFWAVIAFISNSLIFLLVGVQLNPAQFFNYGNGLELQQTIIIAILAVLVARLVMVLLLPHRGKHGITEHGWRFVIFWSGLRGALSLALVLALPLDIPDRNLLILSTYAVVLFTLIVQGFSLRSILKRLPNVAS